MVATHSLNRKKRLITDIKLYIKISKRIEDADRNNTNIQLGYRDGIRQRKMCQAHTENWKKIKNEEVELPNQERIRTLGGKKNYKNQEILEVDPIKQAKIKEKKKKRKKISRSSER